MRVLIEIGNAVKDFYFADDTAFEVDKPMRGWITAKAKGQQDVWLQAHYIIGMFPAAIKEAS